MPSGVHLEGRDILRPRVRLVLLRVGGVLLLGLGLLHLAATPFIVRMLQEGAAPDAAAWLTPPMVLNHVVVGILLLPCGGLIYYAAPGAAAGARWALVVSRSIALAIAALVPTLFLVMGLQYFGALPFRIATTMVCAATGTLLVTAFWPSGRHA